MLRKELAKTGVFIPEIGLGTWDYRQGSLPLRKGLEAGALFIDTAELYGNEDIVGEAIRGMREHVFVATKVSPQNFRPADLHRSAERSLRQLGVDAIDLYQLHEPNAFIPICDTMGEMARLVDEGKVRFVGVSNFSVKQMKDAQRALGKYPIVSNQVRYNLIDRTIERDLLPYCRAQGITVIAYSPLAARVSRIWDCDPTGVLQELARATGHTPIQIAINWCVCQEGVVTVPKGNSVEHILENCRASGWRLSSDELALLDMRIRHRERPRVEQLVRKWMPASIRAVAGRVIGKLPTSLRWRFR
jgi:diketogulonate reductase-like aldo/keto reductase